MERLARGERLTEAEPGMDELLTLGLAHLDPIERSYILGTMHAAASHFVEAAHAEAIAAMDRANQLLRLVAEFAGQPAVPGGGVERIPDHVGMTAETTRAVHAATTLIRVAHPIPRTPAILERSIGFDVESLGRGAARQTIYLESARLRQEERAYAVAFSAAGGQIRTLLPPFERMIIVDDRVAFISDHKGDPEKKPGVKVTHPSLVALLARIFEQQWDRATPWMGETPTAPAGVTTPRTRRMLQRMYEGAALKSIATELGVSLSTVHADLKRIQAALGVSSQMALGAWWASDASAAERAQQEHD
ncbi:LuxR C-terminal-related transcriptional regulator [Streptomyces sp. NPDC102264]|uniref:LuxR C-terminal-related transcriptional regulator n=1 Tax=Streptomyces sp. NPDC102264 TaxID=3366149 RepID=UPI00381220B4